MQVPREPRRRHRNDRLLEPDQVYCVVYGRQRIVRSDQHADLPARRQAKTRQRGVDPCLCFANAVVFWIDHPMKTAEGRKERGAQTSTVPPPPARRRLKSSGAPARWRATIKTRVELIAS